MLLKRVCRSGPDQSSILGGVRHGGRGIQSMQLLMGESPCIWMVFYQWSSLDVNST